MFGDLNRCAKVATTLSATAVATWFGTFGAAGLSHFQTGSSIPVSLFLALCESCLATSAVILFWWRRSPLTKDLSISVPSGVEAAQNEMLQKQGITTAPGGKP